MEVYKPKDMRLFNLCEAFFKKALEVLEQYLRAGRHIPLRTYYEPVPHFNKNGKIEGTSYVPYEDQEFGYLIFKCHEALEGLLETKEACNYISEKRYLVIGQANFAPYVLLFEGLKDYLKKTRFMDYQEGEFLDIYAKIENLIFNDEILFRSTAKLENFSCAKNLIKFDDMQFIKIYTQEECKELYRHPSINIYDHTLPHPGDFRIEVLKSKDKNNWGKAGIESKDEIKQIVTTSRLFKDSAVGIGNLESNEPITWFPYTSKACQLLPPHTIGNLCSIEENEIPELIGLWKIIKSINYKNCPSLEIAIKRFNYTHEHREREDSLIDIMIELESLYMKRNEIAELTFKLALRVATFLEASLPLYQGGKRIIFDNVTKAYRLRSSVVHGSKVPEVKIWECGVIKTYLSDSIKQFAKLSPNYSHKHILEKIDKFITGDAKENLTALFS